MRQVYAQHHIHVNARAESFGLFLHHRDQVRTSTTCKARIVFDLVSQRNLPAELRSSNDNR